ncbi:MAG: methyltransferase domain-containing protein, partial [Planctomycetes bacterium]|nr:methyltransferase domain-containing protein [Planctomycetota bacterium]
MNSPDSALAPASFELMDPARIGRLNTLYQFLHRIREEDFVSERYAKAAEAPEACLCTPVDYAADLSFVPERILQIDYGCGDPTVYAQPGETVLDLGSGSGKHCFMIARRVGPKGRVIGIDKTAAMLELSRGASDEVAENLGFPSSNTDFRCGFIENLAWDVEQLRRRIAEGLPTSYEELASIEAELAASPLVEDDSVDLVVSNCVLNLVEDASKEQLFAELHRVIRRGGRAVISDIVAESDVPQELKVDQDLWAGCVSGALRRDRFLQAFVDAGFYGVEELTSSLWQEVGGIRFFSVTVAAYKGKEGPCWETYRDALYTGPFSSVEDDDGHVYPRGVAVPVCEKTANLLSRAPYAG